MNNRKQIAKDFAKSIDSDDIKQIILFGSVARGDDSEDSDIDILIVVSKEDRVFEKFVGRKVADIIMEKEEVISPHIMTEKHFNATKDFSFLQNVLADGVLI